MRLPLDKYTLTQGFHQAHQAWDLAAPTGTAVKSPVTGTVIGVGTNPSYIGGLYIIVREDHSDKWEYYTGHHSAIHVRVGQRVSEGQHIANIGQTGQATGPHTHFQIRRFNGGALMNPADVIKARQPQGGGIPMINDADNEYWRWNKLFYQIRGRNASRQEFKNAAVGRNWLTAMEILSDDGEADQATHAQNIGQIAVKDNWEGQIVGLVRDKTALTDQAKSLSEQIEIQKKEIEALKKQSGGISVEDSVAIKETNSIVKKLWEKISGIFK